jgi:hypothetical protein
VPGFWGEDVPTPAPPRIAPTIAPTALVASLGAPPLPGGSAGDGALAAVYDEAVKVATALAAATGLLAEPEHAD